MDETVAESAMKECEALGAEGTTAVPLLLLLGWEVADMEGTVRPLDREEERCWLEAKGP